MKRARRKKRYQNTQWGFGGIRKYLIRWGWRTRLTQTNYMVFDNVVRLQDIVAVWGKIPKWVTK